MAEYRLTPAAERDLESIWTYTVRQWGVEQTDRYIDFLTTAFVELADSPFEDNGARERYLTHEEVQRLFDELDAYRDVQVGQVIRLLLYTGARKRELLDARWDEIDFSRRMLTVPAARSKSKKPLVSMFCSWDTIRKRTGIPELRLHDLRHSYASFLVNAGRSLYEVQKLLGHYDPKVTMRYAHLSPQSMLDAVNVVGNVVTGARVNRVGANDGRKSVALA